MADFIISNCGYSAERTSWKNHFHMSYEMIYVKTGTIKLCVNGYNYEISDNSLIFISCLEEHSITILSETYIRYYITLDPKQLDRLLNSPKLMSIFKNRPSSFIHVLSAPINTENILKTILFETDTKDSFSQDVIISKIHELLVELFRQDCSRFPLPDKNMKSEIYEVQRYIEKHFKEDIMIGKLADQFYINKYYLTHSFKELTGYSPKQYLMLNRLSYAKELLIMTHMDILEIAVKCGFFDSNSLIRSFKKEYGITPRNYRHTKK
ncbi:MAG: AraC family transcriptional regulator [Oscillospiraceae bacterium]